MLKELFESIVQQAHESEKPEQPQFLEQLSSDDGKRVAYVYAGKIVERSLDADPRNHIATSAGDLVTLVQACADSASPLIFVGSDTVTAILDDERRERVSLKLGRSQHFGALCKLPTSMNQRDAITYFRRELHGTGMESTADALRQVVFERSQTGQGTVQRDNESMGKSIEARVTGTGDLPEFVRGNICVFDPLAFRATAAVSVGCDVRLQDDLFDLWLPPNTLEDARQAATSQLVEYLATELPESTVVRGLE